MRTRLRENNFDLLRLVFATMVVFHHTGELSSAPSLWWMSKYFSPHFAVQAFFFVSGFLVTMSYEKSKTLRSYADKRFRRIAPAYAFVVLTCAFSFVLLSALPPAEYFGSGGFRRYVFFNLILSNFSAPSLPGVFARHAEQAVNGSLWTIKVEVAFYAMVPVIVLLGRKFGRYKTIVAVFVLSLAWRLALMAWAQKTGNRFFAKLAIQAPGQLTFFVIGAVAYYRTEEGKASVPWWGAALGFLGYVFLNGLAHELTAPFCVAAVVYWAAITIDKAPIDVNKYGDISYGMYLYHWPLIQVLVALGLFVGGASAAAVGSVSVVLGAIAISYFSWHFVEKRWLVHRAHHTPAAPKKAVSEAAPAEELAAGK